MCIRDSPILPVIIPCRILLIALSSYRRAQQRRSLQRPGARNTLDVYKRQRTGRLMLSFLKRSCIPGLLTFAVLAAPVYILAQDTNPANNSGGTGRSAASPPAGSPSTAEDVADDATDPQAPTAPSPGVVPPLAQKPGFFTRWGKAYVADWSGNAPGTDPSLVSKRRGTPPPIALSLIHI